MKKFFLLLFLAILIPFNLALAGNPAAPTIVAIDNNLLISGLAPADSDVMIYIDGKFIGSAVVKSKGTGTNNFYFSALGLVEAGEHFVKAAARNKESYTLSYFSEEKTFKVAAEEKLNPAITKNAAEEISQGQSKNNSETSDQASNENLGDLKDFQVEIMEDNEVIDQKNAFRWNLAIFLLFLFAVIAWIFWVNRELSREKALAAKSENMAEKNKTDKNINEKTFKS